MKQEQTNPSHFTLAIRSFFGGLLMGFANLVPGISGGTMLLLAGVYTDFIDSLSELTRFRFRFKSLLVLGVIALTAGVGIVLMAGTLKELVLNHRWIMYSLFIGLTLGGIPVVWRMAKPASTSLFVAATISFGLMVGLAICQLNGIVGSADDSLTMLFLAGLAGSGAMILPGLSGAYLLMLMGQYIPILTAIEQFETALKARDFAAAFECGLHTLLPVGLGVIAGVVIVGNLLRWLLHRYQKMTLGILLGLLLGSVAGLWPFRVGVKPSLGDKVKSQVVTIENIDEIDPKDWREESYRPSAVQVVSSVGLIMLGFLFTQGIAAIGNIDPKKNQTDG